MDTEASGTPSPSGPLRTRPVTEKPMTRNMGWTQRARELALHFDAVARIKPDLSLGQTLHLQLQTVVFHFEIHPRRSDIKGDPFPSVERHLASDDGGGEKKGWRGGVKEMRRSHDLDGLNKATSLVKMRTTHHSVLAAGQ